MGTTTLLMLLMLLMLPSFRRSAPFLLLARCGNALGMQRGVDHVLTLTVRWGDFTISTQ